MGSFQEVILDLDRVEESKTPYGALGQARTFRDLRVWKLSVDLAVSIYEVSNHLPKDEQFGFTSQIRRSAVSITSNIAEGWGRNSERDFARFLDISLGSLNELDSQLELCERVGLLEQGELNDVKEKMDSLGRILHRFRQKLRSNVS